MYCAYHEDVSVTWHFKGLQCFPISKCVMLVYCHAWRQLTIARHGYLPWNLKIITQENWEILRSEWRLAQKWHWGALGLRKTGIRSVQLGSLGTKMKSRRAALKSIVPFEGHLSGNIRQEEKERKDDLRWPLGRAKTATTVTQEGFIMLTGTSAG